MRTANQTGGDRDLLIAGWVCDLVRSLGIEMQVASTNDERWQWRKVKTKNDRRDGLKLAQLSARQ